MRDEIFFAFETVTVGSGNTATALSRTVYDPPGSHLMVSKAVVTVNPGPVISYVINGATVASTVGHRVTPFGAFVVEGFDNIRSLRMTSVSSGTTASISVSYARGGREY